PHRAGLPEARRPFRAEQWKRTLEKLGEVPGVRRFAEECGGGGPPSKGKRKGQGRSHRKKQKKPEVDILSPAAMLNLQYIAHSVADCLYLRGFRWPGTTKSKRGKNKT
uniref:Small lysine rich protein 1 n=1 Tax=Catagonus wagneri TaxID=51154 RepID=A0A8C3W2U0_9CETA